MEYHGFTYIKAEMSHLELLTRMRSEVLRSANKLDDSVPMVEVEEQTRKYYQCGFDGDKQVTYLVFMGERAVGTGSICFYQVMPTYHNPTGHKAYIMNMYTHPEYRNKGVAGRTLDLLVKEAANRNISFIALEATNMGRPLYKKYGFVPLEDEMILAGKSLIRKD